jgi:hypothetical protein
MNEGDFFIADGDVFEGVSVRRISGATATWCTALWIRTPCGPALDARSVAPPAMSMAEFSVTNLIFTHRMR